MIYVNCRIANAADLEHLWKMADMKITIGITEDNPELMKSILEKLNLFDNVEVLWVAEHGDAALTKAEEHLPDLILMDINMPVMNGIEATRRLAGKYPQLKILMLTVFDESEKIFESIMAGASGYLLKDERPQRLIQAIEDAIDGGAPMSPAIAAKALNLIKFNVRGVATSTEVLDFGLTKRELEILEHIGQGDNYQQIADALYVSPKTVRKHIENIYRKLQVHNKVEAVQLALKHGIL